MWAAILLLAVSAASAPAAARVDHPSFALRPPAGFLADPLLADHGTTALAPVVGDGEPERRLVGYFVEAGEADPATFALSTIDAPLELDPSLRQLFAAAVAGHFKRQLDLDLALDQVKVAGAGPARRVEVFGQVEIGGRPHQVEVAFFAGRRSHAVALASFPPALTAALAPRIEASLDSFEPREAPAPWARSRTLVSLAVWGLAGLALALARVLRRRARAREAGRPRGRFFH